MGQRDSPHPRRTSFHEVSFGIAVALRHRMTRRRAVLVAAMLLAACDAANGGDDDTAESGGSEPVESSSSDDEGESSDTLAPLDPDTGSEPPSATADAIIAAHAMPSRLGPDGEALARTAATAVSAASLAQGGTSVVTTGTLTQQGATWSYAAEPTDRLVVDNDGLPDAELWVHTVQGDFTSVDDFLDHSHDLDFDVVIPDVVDARLHSVRNGGQIASTTVGSFVHDSVRYDLDVMIQGSDTFESDSSGVSSKIETRTTGTITRSGYALVIDESWAFELVSIDGDSVQTGVRNVASTLDLDGSRYAWIGVVTQTVFDNGKPTDLDGFWRANGEVRRDGEAWGQYRLVPTGVYISVVLDTPDGAVELQTFHAY